MTLRQSLAGQHVVGVLQAKDLNANLICCNRWSRPGLATIPPARSCHWRRMMHRDVGPRT